MDFSQPQYTSLLIQKNKKVEKFTMLWNEIKRIIKVKNKIISLMIQSLVKVLGIFEMYEKELGI